MANEIQKNDNNKEIKSEENKFSSTLFDKLSGEGEDSILGKMQGIVGPAFMEGLVKQLEPLIDPILTGITESLGDDETMLLLRRNKKDGKAYVHVIDVKKVKAFSIEEDGIKEVIDGAAFIKSLLSGDIAELFKKEE